MAEQSRDRALDRQAEQHSDQVDLVKALLAHQQSGAETAAGHAHDAREGALDRASDLRQAELSAEAVAKKAKSSDA
jgi:hypothetical protein